MMVWMGFVFLAVLWIWRMIVAVWGMAISKKVMWSEFL
jgi:hypothetical protein